jgi:hypothetical protein
MALRHKILSLSANNGKQQTEKNKREKRSKKNLYFQSQPMILFQSARKL